MKNLAFALAAICLASGFASAHSPARAATDDAPRIVSYAEFDLNREQGAKALVGRIKQEARAFCGPQPSPLSLGEYQRYGACVQESATAAVKRVDAPMVTAVYRGDKLGTRLAAR